MKVLTKKIDKIMQITSWTHISDDIRKSEIEKVLSDTYDLGFADGYAQGHCDGYNKGKDDGYHDGFKDGW